jgi:hypothetical protein
LHNHGLQRAVLVLLKCWRLHRQQHVLLLLPRWWLHSMKRMLPHQLLLLLLYCMQLYSMLLLPASFC